MDERAHNQGTRHISEPVAVPVVPIAMKSIAIGTITVMPISPTIVMIAVPVLIAEVSGLMVPATVTTGMITAVTPV